MRKIELHELRGEFERLVIRCFFVSERQYCAWLTRFTTGSLCNSSRRDRYECVRIRGTGDNGFEMEYHTDQMTPKLWSICEEYSAALEKAEVIAKTKCWKYAWKYSSKEWRQKAVLRQLDKALSQIKKEQALKAQKLISE